MAKKTNRKVVIVDVVAKPEPLRVEVDRSNLIGALRSIMECSPEKQEAWAGFCAIECRGPALHLTSLQGPAGTLEIILPCNTTGGAGFKRTALVIGDALVGAEQSGLPPNAMLALEGDLLTVDGRPAATKASPPPEVVLPIGATFTHAAKVPVSKAFNMLNAAAWAANADDETRPLLRNVGLTVSGHVFGTDGHRLTVCDLGLKAKADGWGFDPRFVFGLTNALDRLEVDDESELLCNVYQGAARVHFVATKGAVQIELLAMLTDGMPQYQRVMPKLDVDTCAVVDAKQLRGLVTQAKKVSRENTPNTHMAAIVGLFLDPAAKSLAVYAAGPEGRQLVGTTPAACGPKAPRTMVGLDVAYVLDVLSLWSWVQGLTLQLDPQGPSLVSPIGVGDVQSIVMPIRISSTEGALKLPPASKADKVPKAAKMAPVAPVAAIPEVWKGTLPPEAPRAPAPASVAVPEGPKTQGKGKAAKPPKASGKAAKAA